jgi:hypothetical protein
MRRRTADALLVGEIKLTWGWGTAQASPQNCRMLLRLLRDCGRLNTGIGAVLIGDAVFAFEVGGKLAHAAIRSSRRDIGVATALDLKEAGRVGWVKTELVVSH